MSEQIQDLHDSHIGKKVDVNTIRKLAGIYEESYIQVCADIDGIIKKGWFVKSYEQELTEAERNLVWRNCRNTYRKNSHRWQCSCCSAAI